VYRNQLFLVTLSLSGNARNVIIVNTGMKINMKDVRLRALMSIIFGSGGWFVILYILRSADNISVVLGVIGIASVAYGGMLLGTIAE